MNLPTAILEHLVTDRRWFHQHPELKFQEQQTAQYIAPRLQAAGYEVQTGLATTGVVGVYRNGVGPTLMLRADMDALPVTEENAVSYASANAGVMHACGHDGHMAMLLIAAEQLMQCRENLYGTLKVVFQPGEEGGNGALVMINEGILENPAVDAAFGIHLWNNIPVGKVGVVDGPVMAAVDEFNIVVHGRGGHAAMPHQTVDAIYVASQIVVALQSIVARNVNPLEAAVVTVGSFHAGEAFNVIAETARLSGTVRTFNRETYERLPTLFNRVVTQTAAALGAECEIDFIRLGPPTINDPRQAAWVREIVAEIVGPENIVTDERARTMAGEDMAYFLEKVPGCFLFVGSGNPAQGLNYPHHSPKFNFDEAALPIGVAIFQALTQRFLRGN
jgi:amidohydrolase